MRLRVHTPSRASHLRGARWALPVVAALAGAGLAAPGAIAAPAVAGATAVGAATAAPTTTGEPINCAAYVDGAITAAVYQTEAGRACVRLLASSATDVARRHHVALPRSAAPLTATAEAATTAYNELDAVRFVARTLTAAAARTEAAAARLSPAAVSGPPSTNAAGDVPIFVLDPIIVIGTRDTYFDPVRGIYDANYYAALKFAGAGVVEALAHAHANSGSSYLNFVGLTYYAPFGQITWSPDHRKVTFAKSFHTTGRLLDSVSTAKATFGTQGEFKGADVQTAFVSKGGLSATISAHISHLGFQNATLTGNYVPITIGQLCVTPCKANVSWQVGINHKGQPSGSLAVATKNRGIFDIGVNLTHSPVDGFRGEATIRIDTNW